MSLRIPKWLLDIADKIYLQPTPMFISWNPQFHKLKGKEILNILDIMQPGDILLRRHGGYLNSLAIPGYWTHASIVYDKDTIAHAVGKGTCYENIFDWFRADGCALLRPNQTYDIDNILEKVETIVGVDYQYDYEFKADNGMIYCTEFIDIIYDGLFVDAYQQDSGGGETLLPDSIRNSDKIKCLIEFKH